MNLTFNSRKFFLISVLLLSCFGAGAHPTGAELSNLTGTEVSWLYLKLGFTHILPLGLDHILFILGLYFLSPNLKHVIGQATAFTVAHCITLALAVSGTIQPLSSLVEPVIALSIVFVAAENFFTQKVNPFRIVVVFAFGLIHGMGFASALKDIGLPDGKFVQSVLMFNLGVELGQVTIILLAYFLIGKWFSKKDWYRQRIVYPVSAVIALVAIYWTIERAMAVI